MQVSVVTPGVSNLPCKLTLLRAACGTRPTLLVAVELLLPQARRVKYTPAGKFARMPRGKC